MYQERVINGVLCYRFGTGPWSPVPGLMLKQADTDMLKVPYGVFLATISAYRSILEYQYVYETLHL